MANQALIAALRERAHKRLIRPKRNDVSVSPATFPRAVELEYRRSLRGIVRASADVIRRHLYPILDTDGNGTVEAIPVSELRRALEKIRLEMSPSPVRVNGLSVSNARATESANRKAMNAQYRKAIGIEPFQAPSEVRRDERTDAKIPVQQVLDQHVRTNVRLITSIPEQMLDQVESLIRDQFTKGIRVESIRDLIEERFSVAESRAALIARDQVSKLNGQLTETRNREMGVTSYVWQTAQDERVRGNPDGLWPKGLHYELNGQTFRYDDPPVTNSDGDRNHPGGDYQCRCIQLPNLEEALTALGI